MHYKTVLISFVGLASSVSALPTGDNQPRSTCLGSIGVSYSPQPFSYFVSYYFPSLNSFIHPRLTLLAPQCIAGTQYCSYNGQLTSLYIPCTEEGDGDGEGEGEEKRGCPPVSSSNQVCGSRCFYGWDECRDGTVKCMHLGLFASVGATADTGVPC